MSAAVWGELARDPATRGVVLTRERINETLDDATHQRLIEDFIARVGAST